MNFDPALLNQALSAIPYPISTADLVKQARQFGLPDQVMGFLENLPDKTFNSADEVKELVGGLGSLSNLNLGNLGNLFS